MSDALMTALTHERQAGEVGDRRAITYWRHEVDVALRAAEERVKELERIIMRGVADGNRDAMTIIALEERVKAGPDVDDADKLREVAEHIGGRYPGGANALRRVASKIYAALAADQSEHERSE